MQLDQKNFNNFIQSSSETSPVATLPRKPPKPAAPKQQQELFYVDEALSQLDEPSEPYEETASQYKVLRPQNPYSRNTFSSQSDNNSRQLMHRLVEKDSTISSSSLVSPVPQNEEISDRALQAPLQQQSMYFNSHTLGVIREENNNQSLLNSGLTPIKQMDTINSGKKVQQLQKEIEFLETRIRQENKFINQRSHHDRSIQNDNKENRLSQENRSTQQQNTTYSQERRSLPELSYEERQNILRWLQEIRLIKRTARNLEEKLPEICQDGVIFFDLLNRINGREGVIHGAIRHPKTPIQISHNYRRIIAYLSSFERFNPRTINTDPSQDSNAFWILLADIKTLFKIQETKRNVTAERSQEKFTLKNTSMVSDKVVQTVPSPKTKKTPLNFSPATYSQLHSKVSSSKKFDLGTPKQSGTPTHSYIKQSPSRSTMSGFNSQSKITSQKKLAQKHVTIEMSLFVQNYLKEKYPQMEQVQLEKDPIRNGEFIREILGMALNYRRTLSSIEEAINCALDRVQEMVNEGSIPYWCGTVQASDIMKQSHIGLGLYWWIIKLCGRPVDHCLLSSALPYKIEEIEQLKRITLSWVRELQPYVQSFPDMIAKTQTGVLLCEITSKVIQKTIEPLHRLPQTQLQCINNIVKALTFLRTMKVGKKFLWKEKDIYDGDQLIILGLFEDIRRFEDGMPERSGNNYFIEGPYLKQPLIEQCDLPRPLPPRPEINQSMLSLENPMLNQYSPHCTQHDKPFSLMNKVNRSLNFDNNKELLKQHSLKFAYKSNTSTESEQQKQSKVYYSDDGVKEWLNQFFDGLGNKINWNSEVLEEFRDGTLLVQIVEKCETKKLTGVVPKPKTTAACTANVRKVFATLKMHPQMTGELLFDAEKTLQGDKEFIIKLIKTLKIIYKNLRR